jgi:hypothetical protein
MRVTVAVREIRSGDSILIEGRDKPLTVASVTRFRGLTSITACDPDSVDGPYGAQYPTDCVSFVLDDADRVAALV